MPGLPLFCETLIFDAKHYVLAGIEFQHEISGEMATAPIAISRATSTNSNSAQQWPYLVSTVSYHTCEKGVFTESIDFNTYMKPSWIMVPWPGHIMHAWH